ncbi:MAG TPA: SdrD B-like domain-containing protein, partial [Dissulfurispiraceae bacterium]|nr:SdrD B-like domain-containing protein [Dissulfurispiraceae bacterium]
MAAGPVLADLGASVTLASGQPGTIYPGQTTQLQITLSNSNASAQITGAAFSNSLPGTWPDALRISGAATYTCADANGPIGTTGTLTAAVGTQTVSLAGGTIPARVGSTDGTCTLIIPVTAGTSNGGNATYTYTILTGSVTGTDGAAVQNIGNVNQSINVLALSPPTISKNFSSSTVYLGGNPTTLTITITNPNSSTSIPNFSVTDAFPQLSGSGIIRVAPSPNATSTCTAGGVAPSFTPTASATTISAAGGTIAPSGTCTITVSVEAAHTNSAYTTGAQANTINASSQFTNDLGIPAAANASRNITVTSPLSVNKAFAHGSLSSGQADTFIITLTNSSTSPITITTFDDNPIDGIAGTGYGLVATGGSTTCAGGSVSVIDGGDGIRLTNGIIPPSGTCTVTVNFTGTVQTNGVPISYTNTIAQGAIITPSPGVVSQSRSASILVADDLRVLKSATPANPAPGNPVRFSVTVQNYAVVGISTLTIRDNFSNGMTFLTGTINGNNYTPSLSGASCSGLSVSGAVGAAAPVFTIATVPARTDINNPGTCTVTFWAMTSTSAANGSSIANVFAASDVCYNGGATCNGGSSNTTGGNVTTAILSAAKSFSPVGPLPEGSISTMTIALTNLSANVLTNVSISDTLPTAAGGGQMRIATPANAASTCGSPTITAVAGSTSLSMNGGTVPARAANGTGAAGACLIRVDVIGPAGIYSNTATAGGTETYANSTTHTVGPVNANASLTYNSSLSATKGFSPSSVSSGGRSTVTIRLANAGATALTNVSVTDPLPAGMVVAPTPNAYTTCAGSTAIAAAAGAGTVTMTGAAIAGLGNCDLLFDVVATGGANWTNTIPVGNITADGGVRNQSAVAGTLAFNAPTNLTVSKATYPSTLTFPGQVSQLTITITNGTLAVTNLRLTDYFTANGTSGAAPNGMVIAATPAVSTTCPGGIVSAAPGGTTVGLSGVSLAASAACTVSVNVTSTTVGGITNYIPAGSILTDQGLTNSGQATTSLTTQSNLGVAKRFTPNVVKPGQRSRLRITFYNPTNLPMANLAVTDTLPAGVTVPSGPNPVTTCTGATVSSPASNQVRVAGGTIAAASGGVAASCYAEIDVLVAASGDYLNTIPAGGVTATSGGSPVSNSQPTSDTLRAKAPLTIHKAIANLTLDAGNPASFTTGTASRAAGAAATMTIRLENANTTNLTGAAFTDALPNGLVVATTPNASTTCAGGGVIAPASATSIRLSGATVPASGSCAITVDVLSNISGVYTNTIPAGSVTTVEGVSNEEPTSAQLIVSTPPTVSKQFSPAVIPPGGISTLTIFLNNDNTSAITLASIFTDTLPTAPGPITVASPPSVAKTCPGAVTANASSGTVSYANGATIPAGGCTIAVNVTGSTAGVHTNNIPAGALQTNLGNNQQPANSTLTVSTLGYISGRVLRDNNVTPNGTFEPGTDTPIAGVSIELHTGASCAGALVSVAGLVNPSVTDAAGNYLFAGLPAGTYSVCEPVQPTGTVNGITTAGTITSVNGSTGTAGAASNPTAATSQIVGIVLNQTGAGGEISGSPNNNFAEVVLSSISGTVFFDENNNGVQNGADAGIAGVVVELLNGSGTVIATITTDANGNYSFTNLQPGTYSLREPNQPANTSNGITTPGAVANGGTLGTATNPATLPSRIGNITLPPNTASSGNNFAEVPNGRRISGVVFLDFNNNGALDGSDHGIGGQTLNLAGNDVNGNPVSRTTTTNADGTYDFLNLPEGTYTVTEPNQPAGTTNGQTLAGTTGGAATAVGVSPSVISAIPLTGSNTVSAANNFAEIPGASPDLAIAKTHAPASLGASSSTGYFTLTPSNVGAVASSGTITITDTLPAGLTPISAAGTGWTCTIAGQLVTCTSTTVIGAGATGNAIILRISVGAGLAGQVLTNTALISGGGEPAGFEG